MKELLLLPARPSLGAKDGRKVTEGTEGRGRDLKLSEGGHSLSGASFEAVYGVHLGSAAYPQYVFGSDSPCRTGELRAECHLKPRDSTVLGSCPLLCEHMCLCMCMHTCAHACAGQKITCSAIPQVSLVFLLNRSLSQPRTCQENRMPGQPALGSG